MVAKTSISFPFRGRICRLHLSLNCGKKFRDEKEARDWFSRYFKLFFQQHFDIKPKHIRKLTENGVVLTDGRLIGHPQFGAASLWKTLPLMSKLYPQVVDQKLINEAEPPEIEPGIARADFQFLDPTKHVHLLDSVSGKARWASLKFPLSRQSLVDLETARLVEAARQAGKSPTQKQERETRFGVGMGVDQRRNYRLTVQLENALQKFFNRRSFISDEIFAKNSPLNGVVTQEGTIRGAVNSSFNRLADTVTLMRKVEAEDGSSDCYAGRVDTEEKAKEMAQFIFFGEIEAFENNTGLSKGIHLQKDGTYQLTFSVQSLLSMSRVLSYRQRRKFYEEVKAYQKLIEQTQTTPLEIRHPKTGKIYRVTINPLLPIASNQFNFLNRLEFAGFGKTSALTQSRQADAQLAELADQKIRELNGTDSDRVARIQTAIQSLQNDQLKPWQIVMIRSYLCHLLEIPQIVHCLGSVDRTGGVAIPMITVMKQWLRSKRPIPSSIIDIVDTPLELPDHSIIQPFKHLFYYKMLHELKVSEFSRGRKGFKLDEVGPLHHVHTACRDLLPENCFQRGHLKYSWAFKDHQVRNRNLIY